MAHLYAVMIARRDERRVTVRIPSLNFSARVEPRPHGRKGGRRVISIVQIDGRMYKFGQTRRLVVVIGPCMVHPVISRTRRSPDRGSPRHVTRSAVSNRGVDAKGRGANAKQRGVGAAGRGAGTAPGAERGGAHLGRNQQANILGNEN